MTVDLVKPPLPRSYLVFLPVLAGPYPGAGNEREAQRRLQCVLDEGCDLFLDLTQLGECEPYAHLLPPRARHVRMPLRAGAVPAEEAIDEIVAAIDHYSAAEGWFIYVHDANGIGRVGTAISCWIGSMPQLARDPITFLDELRKPLGEPWLSSPSLPEQRAFVRRWSHTRRERPDQLVEGGSW